MIGVTVLAIWLGYSVNWQRERHAFLAEQLKRHLATELVLTVPDGPTERRRIEPEGATAWWHEQIATRKSASWLLRPLGEQGVGKLWVVVPAQDITVRNWGKPEFDASIPPWGEISALQGDYQRAKRLFPEAQVRPIAPDDIIPGRDGVGHTGWLHPGVTVRNLRQTILRVVCNDTVAENTTLNGRFQLNTSLEGVAIIPWHTRDGTATSKTNYQASGGKILAEPGQKDFAFAVKTSAHTAVQRAAGGATFKIKLGTVVGAAPEVREKTVTILPAKR